MDLSSIKDRTLPASCQRWARKFSKICCLDNSYASMTWRNIKRWREEDLELESKRYRQDTFESDPSAAESMAPAKRSTDDALLYLRLVRETFKEDQSKYKEFLGILKQFQNNSIDTGKLVSLVKTLFEAHPELLLGLNEFLPKGHQIENPEPEVLVVPSSCGNESLSPSGQPTAVQEDMVDLKGNKDLQRALNFVNKVSRFCKEEHVYARFLGILNHYKKGLDIEEVTRRISCLLVGHEDLVEEFAGFLPACKKCGSYPACSLKQILWANSGQHDKANGILRKECCKRVSSPTDCHQGAEDVGDRVQDAPKGKKQCREEDKDLEVDVGPMNSSPCKRQRKNDAEEEKDMTVHVNHQAMTEEEYQNCLQHPSPMLNKQWQTAGIFPAESDKSDGVESKEHPKEVEEPMDTRVPRESPLKVRILKKKSSTADEEDSTLSKSKEHSSEGEEMNVGSSRRMPHEHSLRNIKKLHKRNEKLREENGTTHPTTSDGSAREGGMLGHVSVAQTWPQEHSSPTVGKRQKKTADVQEEKITSHQSEKKKPVKEGIEEPNVCPSRMLSQEPQSPEIIKQQNDVEEGSFETRQSGSSESAEEDDQTGVCVSPKQHQIEMQQKSDKTEEEDAVVGQPHAKQTRQWVKTDEEEENKANTDHSERDGYGKKKAGVHRIVDAPENVPLKRTSARVARELIWKQCQAAEARQAVKALNFEEEQRRKRLQLLEDKRALMLQQKQHEFFEKLRENLKRRGGAECFHDFCKEVFSCPELQSALSEGFEEQEVEYSECKRCTASYFLLPKSYIKPLTTHRKELHRIVLNDNLVSVGYDDDCDDNSQDESAGARKQIRRESTGKRVPHDERLLHEEKLFLCEDDQYELDVLRHTTASTVRQIEKMVEVMQCPGFCKKSFDWNEYLTPLHFRCIERIYGDYGVEFIHEAQRNPVVSLPIILRHLKRKEEDEWPKYQVEMNKYWAEAHAEHFHKSLDYSQTDSRDSDTVQVSMDSFPLESSINEDLAEDDSEPVTDYGPELVSSLLGCNDPDLGHMYEIVKHLLKEGHMTEEQLDKIQTVWSAHVDSTDGVLDISQDKQEKEPAGDLTDSSS